MRDTVLRKYPYVKRYLCTTGFILLSVVLYFQTVNSAHGQTPPGQQEKASSGQSKPEPSPSQTAIQQPEASVEARERGDKPSSFWGAMLPDWIQVGINAALLVIIAFQTKIYWQQRQIMQSQIDQARISERAYLGVAEIGLTDLVVGKVPSITANIQNAGRTPAWKVKAPAKISLLKAGTVPAPERITSKFAGDGVLAAGGSRKAVYLFGEVCDEPTYHGIENRTLSVFIQGEIWYEDAWGQEHSVPFFLEWSQPEQAFVDRREHESGKQEHPISN